MVWWKFFTCKSQCKFNAERDCPDQMFDRPWDFQRDYTLKDKDLKKLLKIFKKRRNTAESIDSFESIEF